MKQTHRSIFFALILVCNTQTLFSLAQVTPFFNIRSQGEDAARELIGTTPFIHKGEMNCVYGCFSLTPEYTKSFDSPAIARTLFGSYACNDSCPSARIPISGSQVQNRGPNDWLADYFYLPTDYQSILEFTPTIQGALIDIDFYLGLDKWVPGLFGRFQAPITWTRWRLNVCETNIKRGVNNYDPGYFNGFQASPSGQYPIGVGIFRDNLLESASRFFAGDTIITPSTVSYNSSTNIFYDALAFAKIDNCNNSKTGLADIHLTLGWNFLACADYHAGIGLRVVGPTGSRPDGIDFFEPVVGNGKHWEVGLDASGHAMIWQSLDESQYLGFYADAHLTTMLTADHKRTFDLKGKPFSRYMLVELITTPTTNGLMGSLFPILPPVSPTSPIAQFKNELAPLANISTLDVRVSVPVQVDIAAQFTYRWCHLTIDFGYNFWATACERITSGCPNAQCTFIKFDENAWALKGDSYVYGFARNPAPIGGQVQDLAVPLSATDSSADITHGSNNGTSTNLEIDNPQFAFAQDSGGTVRQLTTTLGGAIQTRTSIQPVFVSMQDLDFVGTQGISHKLYLHLSHNWFDHPCWIPFIGAGIFAEWAGKGSCKQACVTKSQVTLNCESNCTASCIKCPLSQWGIWVKGGVAF